MIYYCFKTIGKNAQGQEVGWYTRSMETDAQPPSSTPWEPPPVPEGYRAFFDGMGWRVVFANADVEKVYRLQIQMKFEDAIEALKDGYSFSEVDSWAKQEQEARLKLDGRGSDYIDMMAQASDEDPRELAQKIVDKADTYHLEYAEALGNYRKAQLKKPVEKDLDYLYLIERNTL